MSGVWGLRAGLKLSRRGFKAELVRRRKAV
jgi:hypothetical protein